MLLSFLLMLSLLWGQAARASQEEHSYSYVAKIFNESDGLLTGEANDVTIDTDGYLWIASYSGLIRYDGSVMVNYSDRLSNPSTRALFMAGDGSMYIGTNGACVYRMKDDVFEHFEAEDKISYLAVRGFAEDKDGIIYCASTSGIAKIVDGVLIPVAYEEMEGGEFYSLRFDDQGNLWGLTIDGTVHVFNEQSYLFEIRSEEIFPNGTIDAMGCDKDNNLFFGSSDGEVCRFVETGETVPGQMDTYAKTSFHTEGFGSLLKISPTMDGRMIICGLNGFGYIDQNDKFHSVNLNEGSSILYANSACIDREGNFWVATSNNGVVRYSKGCFESCNENSDLKDVTANAIAHLQDRFYVATDVGILVFDEEWKEISSELTDMFKDVRVRNLQVDRNGCLWMATYSPEHGAMRYDPATGETTDFGLEKGIASEKMRVIYELSDGRMLVGHQLGFNIIEDDKVTENYGTAEGMDITSVLCAMELGGRIYVGTDGGGIYELTDQGLVHLSFEQGLTETVILRMIPDSDNNGNYYVCAGDKLFYCEEDHFRRLSNFKLESGSLFSIYDTGKKLWAFQNSGIEAADKEKVLAGEDVYIARYGMECGLTGTLRGNTWNWLEEDGSLYIPTRAGVSKFYFEGPDIGIPDVILNGVTIDDVLTEHPSELEIPGDARRVTFDISELLLAQTCEFTLGYQLKGFDTEEILTMDKHVNVSYTNLPGGDYTLTLRVIDPVTGESTPKQEIHFIKEKKITEQAWFYVACVLGGILIIGLLFYAYLRHKTRLLMKREKEQQRMIDEITAVFSKCVDLRDHYTNGHSARVGKYTAMLAQKLGKSKEEVEWMYRIGLLHDVGKISIPDSVLNKPGRLTNEEFAIMKTHSQAGYDVLKDIDVAPDLALGARCHHERYDGNGYPQGLKGEEIPEVAQIIAVADTFDAMYSTRPYRKKMELPAIVAEIKRCSGTQLSPRVVEAFLALVEEGAFDDCGEEESPEATS